MSESITENITQAIAETREWLSQMEHVDLSTLPEYEAQFIIRVRNLMAIFDESEKARNGGGG